MTETVDDVIHQMHLLRKARAEWELTKAQFESGQAAVLTALILKAVEKRMSVEQVAEWTGVQKRQIREVLRSNGVDPKQNRGLMAASAAEALHGNAALLGIDPSEMDLSSPLAYLPAGSLLRKAAQAADVELED